jgi:short-subunit dehydrogenase
MSTTQCAQAILKGVAAGKMEFGIGGKELLGLRLRRLFPSLFEKILRKQSAR